MKTVEVLLALGDAVRDLSKASPLGGVPSGDLYAHVMRHLTLDEYQACVAALKRAGLVSERGHLLTWTGGRS